MRKLVVAVYVLVVAAGCHSGRNRSTAAVAARAALDQYVIDFWVKGDTAALGRALSPTMIYHYNGKVIPGDPPAHFRALRSFGPAFSDLTGTVDVFTVSGNLGAAVTTWTGSHTGTLCQTRGSGKKVTWAVNYLFRMADGRIVELWETWDPYGMYRQLGLDITKCG